MLYLNKPSDSTKALYDLWNAGRFSYLAYDTLTGRSKIEEAKVLQQFKTSKLKQNKIK